MVSVAVVVVAVVVAVVNMIRGQKWNTRGCDDIGRYGCRRNIATDAGVVVRVVATLAP